MNATLVRLLRAKADIRALRPGLLFCVDLPVDHPSSGYVPPPVKDGADTLPPILPAPEIVPARIAFGIRLPPGGYRPDGDDHIALGLALALERKYPNLIPFGARKHQEERVPPDPADVEQLAAWFAWPVPGQRGAPAPDEAALAAHAARPALDPRSGTGARQTGRRWLGRELPNAAWHLPVLLVLVLFLAGVCDG